MQNMDLSNRGRKFHIYIAVNIYNIYMQGTEHVLYYCDCNSFI